MRILSLSAPTGFRVCLSSRERRARALFRVWLRESVEGLVRAFAVPGFRSLRVRAGISDGQVPACFWAKEKMRKEPATLGEEESMRVLSLKQSSH